MASLSGSHETCPGIRAQISISLSHHIHENRRGGGEWHLCQVPMKSVLELGLKFRFHYHIKRILAASSLSRGEERKKSKREIITHDCERDV